MPKLTETAKRLMLLSAAISAATIIIPLVVYRGDMTETGKYALGLLLGLITTELRVILLERSLDKALDMEPSRAKLYTAAQFIARYVATGGVLIFAALTPQLMNCFGTAAGLLSLQLAAYLHTFIWKRAAPEKTERG
ncbi:MAG: ATP synthase subunit I [Clostridiales bacterium]|jgi:hypothetical protein|nr:ATP synthase subunit I [Clostridiales bacterium]